MRELDFTEGNVFNRWLGVNSIWRDVHFEVKRYVKRRIERVMKIDLDSHLGCSRYERSKQRRGYRNGSYTRGLLTSYGWIEDLEVPRSRASGYQPSVLEQYHRRQRQVDRVLLEGFLLGHSTRNTTRMFKRLFEGTISAQAISNIVKELDSSVVEFRRKRFESEYVCVYLDGLWITLSKPVKTKKVILLALGVRADGSKDLLSFQVASSESEAWWWGFLSDLKDRGLKRDQIGVIISDGSAGLVKAITALYPHVRRQLCAFHKANDLGAYLTDRRHRSSIVRDALRIFEVTNQTQARKRLQKFKAKWSAREPRAVTNFTKGFEFCLTYLEFPDLLRTMIKTNNPIERYIEEIRRRIIPMRSFNNTRSAERIVYGIITVVLNRK